MSRAEKGFWVTNKLGDRLQEFITKSGFKVTEIIEKLNPVSSKTFYRYLKNKSSPTIDFLLTISQILSIPLNILLNISDDSVGMEKEEDGFFYQTVRTVKRHTEQAISLMQKELHWEKSLAGKGDRLSFNINPQYFYMPENVIRNIYQYLNMDITKDKHSISKINPQIIINEVQKKRDSLKNIFRRDIFLQSGLLNFAMGKFFFESVSIADRINIVENMLSDFEENFNKGMLQFGFVKDSEILNKERFYVMENKVVIYTKDFYHVVNDRNVARHYKNDHEAIWHNQACLKDPKQIIIYLKKMIEKILESKIPA